MEEQTYKEFLAKIEGDEHALQLDGFDDCVIGAGQIANQWVLIYSEELIIEKLCEQMDYDEAWEHYAFNMTGYVGTGTPLIQSVKITQENDEK